MPGEHFVIAPHWEWWILGYFFFAGISGGTYVLGTMLRLWGSARDTALSRVAFLISFPTLLAVGRGRYRIYYTRLRGTRFELLSGIVSAG